MSIEFSDTDIQNFYKLLSLNLTAYNCGNLCAPENGGEPYCCIVENAVPLLYREEFKYLQNRSTIWSRWKPKTKHNKKLKSEGESKTAIFCECKGVQFCERENRSISCRTFPLEPYIDEKGRFSGLIFMKEFRGKCPLMKRLADFQQKTIDNHYKFWCLIFEKRPDEFELYKSTSKGWRISSGKTGKELPVLKPSHLKLL